MISLIFRALFQIDINSINYTPNNLYSFSIAYYKKIYLSYHSNNGDTLKLLFNQIKIL